MTAKDFRRNFSLLCSNLVEYFATVNIFQGMNCNHETFLPQTKSNIRYTSDCSIRVSTEWSDLLCCSIKIVFA